MPREGSRKPETVPVTPSGAGVGINEGDMQTGSLLIKAQNKKAALQITSSGMEIHELPQRRYCKKQPLLRYPPGRRPLETFSEWRLYI